MKCPKCDSELTIDDIEDVRFKGPLFTYHFAYVCRKCGYIIGFGIA